MKLDLQSLSAEPLVYMLMHSGAFVTTLGIIFFLIGLLFGRVTWGRYKGQSRELRAEAEAMKEEMAGLKRKLADLSVKSGPAVPMVTEMILLPKKERTAAVPPAIAGVQVQASGDKNNLPASVAPPASASLPEQPASPPADVIKPKAPAQPESASNGTSPAAVAPAPPPPPPPPVSDSASVTIPISPDAASAAAHLGSPQAAIVPPPPASVALPASVPSPAPQKELASVLGKDMLMLPEIPMAESPPAPTPAPAVPKSIKPEFDFDPQLGLIYRTKPESSDDLTALKGVASTLEQRLHTLGVYTYEQIASWTHDQVREFSTRLAFKDRIEREQWVEQARELLASQQRSKRQLEASLV